MTRSETAISLKMPTELVEKLDIIVRQKYLKRADIIIDACAFYCQFYDMNSERLPETMRNVFFNHARHDDEFRKMLRDVLTEDPTADYNKASNLTLRDLPPVKDSKGRMPCVPKEAISPPGGIFRVRSSSIFLPDVPSLTCIS